jgi:hypothetical protein
MAEVEAGGLWEQPVDRRTAGRALRVTVSAAVAKRKLSALPRPTTVHQDVETECVRDVSPHSDAAAPPAFSAGRVLATEARCAQDC